MGRAIEGEQGLPRNAAIKILDGNPARGGVLSIDCADQRLDAELQLFVLGYVPTAGDGNLDKRDPVSQLRMAFQQSTEGVEALHDALRVIQTIDAKNDLSTR